MSKYLFKKGNKLRKGLVPWNKGLHIYTGGKKFIKGNLPPQHKQGCKCFRCDKDYICSSEIRKKIANSNRGQIRPSIRGENSPCWRGGLPKCLDCGKELKNYSAKKCREHNILKGYSNPNWKGGNFKCLNCKKELGSRRSKWCRKCSLQLQKHNGPDWKKYKHPFLGKKLGPLSEKTKRKISEANSGEKSYLWKGGITPKNNLERTKFRIRFQKQVFERDNYTCQLCGQIGGKLQADHIQPWAEYIELRFNIENCRTLCMVCHYKITYGKPMPPSIRAWGYNFIQGGFKNI